MRDRKGFTIIELLAVVTIMGILATIGLPRYQLLKERAKVASMVSDLRHVITSQEAFFSAFGDYAGSIGPGPEIPGTGGSGRATVGFSPNVTIEMTYRSNPTTGEGWSAVARHSAIIDPITDECGVFVGDVSYSPNAAVTRSGKIECF